ncbi:MAG TPA: phospholipid carrier-dependent glycosyltransferase, partial [Ktedonobacteraceae bacterium]|nr:phospholipid carrier-dependent glycosyltransferase [Ktedonobacteraceae bacterium]
SGVSVNGEPAAPLENPQRFPGRIFPASAHSRVLIQDAPTQALDAQVAPPPEVVNGNIILYRRPNFFVRTAYRPGQKQPPLRKPSGYTAKTPTVIPDQGKRIASGETRLMPKVTVHTIKQTRAIPLPAWLEAVIVVLALAGTCVSHAFNMFHFPRYELDEGTYMSNAWAFTQGMLSPYPYGYGHPPLAWIQIAAWIKLTGGIFTFGNALNSGRAFMLLYAVGSALLVYLIVRRLGGSRSAALLAPAIFSFSPLSITYQVQVFLDNIATFWLLLSIYLLVVSNSRLIYIVLAAIALGISILSKEVYVVALPAMIYGAWLHTTRFQRKFTLVAFIYIVIAICSGFVLLAVLKGELFPDTWHLPGDTHPHLSMWDTFIGQAQRGQENGSLAQSLSAWEDDKLFLFCSLAAPGFNLLYGLWNRKLLLYYLFLSLPPFRFFVKGWLRKTKESLPDVTVVRDRHFLLALLALFFWLLLVRGGQVLSFYILPLIPLVALNTAMALNTILGWLGRLVRLDVVRAILLVIAIAAVVTYDVQQTGFRFYQHPTSAQNQALVWIRAHVPHNAFIVINSYLYLDLHVPGGVGVGDGAPYPHAEIYWNVAYDPELYSQSGALENNPDRIDYIVADSEMLRDIQTYGGQMDIINQALKKSVKLAEFRADDHSLQIVVDVFQVIHKNPPQNVYQSPAAGSGALAQASTTALPGGPPRSEGSVCCPRMSS